jgi:hypothetical protein
MAGLANCAMNSLELSRVGRERPEGQRAAAGADQSPHLPSQKP